MKHILTALLFILVCTVSFGQETYLSVGRNFTTYDFTNSSGESNLNVQNSSGASYEVGYAMKINPKLGLAIGVTLNQYNATYKMTKREFYQTFYNVVSSRSYKEIGSYICMVLASDIYDEGDYIRNYNNFKKIKKS